MSLKCDVDLSFLRGNNTVINCRTQEEATMFCAALDEQFPGITFPSSARMWDAHRKNFCYRVHLPEMGYKINFSNVEFYKNSGYDIISFSSLVTKPDFGEIDAECFSIESMMEVGME